VRLTAVILLIASGCLPFALPAQQKPNAKSITSSIAVLFKDVADQNGLKFQHYNGMTGKFYLPEITGSGGALFDFDNDGDLDVYLVQGATLEPNTTPATTMFLWRDPRPPRGRLFRNELITSGSARRGLSFTDVTDVSGIAAAGYGMGAAVGDINNDGLPDLYLTNLGSNQIYLNKGGGKFVDVTKESGTDDPRWTTSASFVDYDRDGWLDLMIVNYADFSVSNSPNCYAATTARDYCTPRVFRSPGNRLFHNKGNGTFEDVTAAARVDKEFGHGLGVVTADFNDDGWPDIYVANDGDPNQLWINQKNGTFVNDALLAGAAVNRNGQAEAGMGVDAGDFDGNGTEDIFITHLMDETNTLYVNTGEALFDDRTREAGLGMPGRRFTGFGTSFFDYDNDGWLDLFVANGAVQLLPALVRQKDPFPLGQPNQVFRNTGKGSFVEIDAGEAGPEMQLPEVSRGAIVGDVDNDGDTDVLVTNNNGPARLLLNQVGNRNHWLGLRVVGKNGRDALGARVDVVTASGSVLRRRVRTDGSYLSANDARVLVGLGAATQVKSVRVRWPNGTTEEWKNVAVDRYITLNENTARTEK
jgi:enediyne biosynthesis protein E4